MRIVTRPLRRCARAAIAAVLLTLVSCAGGKPVLMLAPEKDFYDPEYSIPRARLEAAGYTIVVATPSGKEAVGLEGLKIIPDKGLAGLSAKSFSALFLVGGTGAASFMGDGEVHRIIREFDDRNAPIGAQCITPAVVAEAGLLDGLEATCWPSFRELLESHGAKFSGRVVDQQGNILTAQAGREDYIEKFVDEYIALLKDKSYVIPELRSGKASKIDSFAVSADRTGFTATVRNVQRSGRLFVPAEYDGSAPWALVFGLHGSGGSGATFQGLGFNAVAGELGFIMCYPDGASGEWSSPEDVAFISNVIEGLKKEFSIDGKRVYLTGHSAGAMMAYRLAQALPGAFAAVAPVAGLLEESVPTDDLKAVPFMHLHAMDDDVVRIEGVPGWGLKSMEESVAVWKRVNGASGEGNVFYDADGIRGTMWKGTSADTAMVMYAGGKHAWPQDAVGFISEFFYNHPARGLMVSLKPLPDGARPGSSVTVSLSDSAEPRIARLAFFDNGQKIGEATRVPWALKWDGVPKGLHRVTARATLTDGSEVRTARAETLWSASPSLAEGRQVKASGAESDSLVGEAAVDGNPRTRWSSAFDDDGWIMVDLGAGSVVNGFTLFWESAYGLAYAIEVSDDGNAWRPVYGTESGKGGVEFIDIPPEKTRYVRLKGIKRGTPWGYSLWEFLVHGERA